MVVTGAAMTLVTVDDLADDWGLSPIRVAQILRDGQVPVFATDGAGRELFQDDLARQAREQGINKFARQVRGDLVLPGGAGPLVPWQQLSQGQRDNYLPPQAAGLIRKGIPDSTWNTYRQQWMPFDAWCNKNMRTSSPVSENTMITYLDHLRNKDPRPAPSTIWIWYSAVRFVHKMGNPPTPWECGGALALAMAGYEKEMLEAGWRPKRAPRAYPEFVRAMVDKCDLDTLRGIHDKALILAGFMTASRASHMTIFRLHDVTTTPLGIEMRLPWSKANQPGVRGGRTKRVRNETFAIGTNTENSEYCAVTAVNNLIGAYRHLDIREGALCRQIHKQDSLARRSYDPAYRIHPQALTNTIAKYARLAGLSEKFTFHSLRRGLATWLRELGFDPVTIAETFGWSPSSAVFLVYMEEAQHWQEGAPAFARL